MGPSNRLEIVLFLLLMTHHHHCLTLGNLGKFSGGHTLGPFRPFCGKTRCIQKLSHSGCLDTEVYVLRH